MDGGYRDNTLRLYDLHGNLVDSIQTNSGYPPYDIEVTRNGCLVYADYRDRTVNIVNQKENTQTRAECRN